MRPVPKVERKVAVRPSLAAVRRGILRFLLASICCGGVFVHGEDDDRPYQFRDPKRFWLEQQVFQKRGIVVEDDDYIVRRCYWVLDPTVVGQVTDVEVVDDGAFLTVRFENIGGGWRKHGINMQDRAVSKTSRATTVRTDPYGDGADIQTDEVTFSYRIEGEEVDPAFCGLLLRIDDRMAVVRFPVSLVSLAPPRVGDEVVRSWDWHDGFADGGDRAVGMNSGSADDCVGVVESQRDDKGFVNVRWKQTGRRKSHRFDNFGYYDIQLSNETPEP